MCIILSHAPISLHIDAIGLTQPADNAQLPEPHPYLNHYAVVIGEDHYVQFLQKDYPRLSSQLKSFIQTEDLDKFGITFCSVIDHNTANHPPLFKSHIQLEGGRV